MGIVWLADEAVSTENANLFDYRIFGIVPLAFVRTSVFPEFRQFKVSAVSSAMPAISCPSVFHTPSFFHHLQLFFILSLGTSLSCAIHLAFFFTPSFPYIYYAASNTSLDHSFDQTVYCTIPPLFSLRTSVI